MSLNFVKDHQLYPEVIAPISKAKSFVWIGTADIKDLDTRPKKCV